MDQIKTYATHVHTTYVHNDMHIDLMCKQQLDIQQLNIDIRNMTTNGGNYQDFTLLVKRHTFPFAFSSHLPTQPSFYFYLLVFLCK